MEELEYNESETKHDELLKLLNPLVDFMIENGYNYFLVAGKNGVCTRHLRGTKDDISGMISGMMKDQNGVKDFIIESVERFNEL